MPKLLCSVLLWAGVTAAGSLSGRIVDPSGGPVPGARLQLAVAGAPRLEDVQSDDEGRFRFAALAPGTYELLVQKPGFRSLKRTNIVVDALDLVSPDLILEVDFGCGVSESPPNGFRRTLLRIKRFFVPIDWSKVTICQ